VKYLKWTTTALSICIVAVFISAPAKYMRSFFDGITIWAYNVLPALFPFMVITTLTLKLHSKFKYSLTEFLFKIDCDFAFISSLLCGYPVGAKAVADSAADTETATVMCSFCSSAGPIFMIATVGAKLLQNSTATVIVFTAHLFSVVLNGLLYRKNIKNIVTYSDKTNAFKASDIGETITNSALSVISVGGLIALFYMLADMIKSFLPFGLKDDLTVSFILGLFEMTNGIFGLCANADIQTATVLCSSLLAFGGLCVIAQCYAFLSKKQIKFLSVIKMKATQSSIATIASFILVKIFM